MTHVLGNKGWTGTIASIGLLLAVTGCTAPEPDGGATPSASSSEAAAPTSSASPAPSSSPTPAPAEPSATPSTTPSAGGAPSPSASPSPSPSDAPVPVPTASPSASAPTAAGTCTAAQLTGSVEDQLGGAGAGSVYRTLLLTNASDQSCTLEGYPGVSFVDAGGNQLGAPAERDGSALSTVTLAPGGTAASTLRQTNAQNYGPECGLTTSAGLRVYPPGATDSLILPQEISSCTADSISLMTVGTVQATS